MTNKIGSQKQESSDSIQERSCGVILFNQQNEVLLLQQIAGHWGFPKGHVEGDESYEACALRELKEEVGLDAVILSTENWKIHYYPRPSILKEVLYFIGFCEDDSADSAIVLQEEEIVQARWLSVERAHLLLSHRENAALLASAFPRFLDLRMERKNFRPASLLANTSRPAPLDLPFENMKTPSYLVDLRLLEDNLRLMKQLRERLDIHILLAQKSYSCYPTYPLIGSYVDGTTASGLYEAELGFQEMPNSEVHVFSPAYKDGEMERLLQIADHIYFNSFNQWRKYKAKIQKHNEDAKANKGHVVSCGLRINPEYSSGEHDLYNPAAPGSRLGITFDSFQAEVEKNGLDGIEGLHFHTLCEQNADALAATWQMVSKKFGPYLKKMKWINMGGGHHITRDDYDLALLEDVIRDCQNSYEAQIYLEPGEAFTLNAGFFVAEVQDCFFNDVPIAILDTSATCHMPDVLEMPYQPKIFVLRKESGQWTRSRIASTERMENCTELCRLGGTTCLAGDVIGDYYFPEALRVGDRIVFLDMALYTMVKTNTFNGMPLPSIYLFDEENGLTLLKEFSYEDFKGRLG